MATAAGAHLKGVANLIDHCAHRRPQFGVRDCINERIELRPELLAVLGRHLDEVFEQAGGAQFRLGQRSRLAETRRKPALIIVHLALEPHHGALAGLLQGLKHRTVTENRAGERAGTIAKLRAVERIAVGRGLGGQFLHDQQAGEGPAGGARLEGFQFTNGDEGGGFSHGI
jgi:hypothetical protein